MKIYKIAINSLITLFIKTTNVKKIKSKAININNKNLFHSSLGCSIKMNLLAQSIMILLTNKNNNIIIKLINSLIIGINGELFNLLIVI